MACLKRRSIRHGVGMPCAHLFAQSGRRRRAFLGRLRRRTHTRVGASTHPAHRARTIYSASPARCVARLKRLSIRPGLGCLAPVYSRGVSASNTAALPNAADPFTCWGAWRCRRESRACTARLGWPSNEGKAHLYCGAVLAAIMRAGAVQCPRGPHRARGRSSGEG